MRGPGIASNTVVPQLVGNTDLAPTFLAIAGMPVSATSPPMDGRSFLPLVLGSQSTGSVADGGKVSVPPPACKPDPCNGHGVCIKPLNPQCFCNTGYEGDRCEKCAQGFQGWPSCERVPWRTEYLFEYYPILNFAKNKTKRINDSPENTFRGLRVLNATHNFLYGEITTLKDWHFKKIEHYELYDMQEDPFQLRNLWTAAFPAQGEKAAWHAQLLKVYGCKGSSCP